jgi:hypothetical protein
VKPRDSPEQKHNSGNASRLQLSAWDSAPRFMPTNDANFGKETEDQGNTLIKKDLNKISQVVRKK